MSIAQNFPVLKPSLLLDFASTKQLDNRITFTRSTPAVYYDGKTTAMAEQNLLTNSQNSATNWTQANTTANTSATTAPDGTSTAISLVPSTLSTDEHLFYQTFTGTEQPYTHSVYAKANGYDWVYLRPQIGSSLAWANFNLSTGTIGTVSSGVTATITSVGNGWYRCTATRTQSTGANYMVIGVANADNHPTFAGNGTSSIYIWGAQLEQRSTATAYTATTTQPITNYIPVLLTAGGNQARFDCNPTTGESLGLLIEEQRTNLCTYSEQFNNSNYTKVNSTIATNIAVAPDGTITADLLIPDSANSNDHSVYQATVNPASTTYTTSVYAKAAGYNFVEVFDGYSTNKLRVNLTNGTYTTVGSPLSVSVISVGNGWYRCSFTRAITSGLGYIQIGAAQDLSGTSFVGNGFSGVLIWGAQFEAGSFPTSYIATTSASATRTADAAIMTGSNFSNWFNTAEGTLFTNFRTVASTNFPQVACINDGTTGNLISIDAQSGLRAFVTVNTTNPAFFTASNSGTDNLVSFGYKVNDFGASFNGATTATDTSGNVPNVFQMGIGQLYTSLNLLNGTIKKIAYYPIKVSSANLQALTS